MFSIAVEIPGYVFCLLTINKLGRRPVLSLCQVGSGNITALTLRLLLRSSQASPVSSAPSSSTTTTTTTSSTSSTSSSLSWESLEPRQHSPSSTSTRLSCSPPARGTRQSASVPSWLSWAASPRCCWTC